VRAGGRKRRMRPMLSADHDNIWIHVIAANLWRRSHCSCNELQFCGDEQVTNVPRRRHVLPGIAVGLDRIGFYEGPKSNE